MEAAKKKKPLKNQSNTIISNTVRDYSNDPFFVEKGKASKAFLDKNGFPKELFEKR